MAVRGLADARGPHLLTLTSQLNLTSGHLRPKAGADAVFEQARSVPHDDLGVEHATLQCEPASGGAEDCPGRPHGVGNEC